MSPSIVRGFVATKDGHTLDDIASSTPKTPSSDWARFARWRESDPIALSVGMRAEVSKIAGARPTSGGFSICCPFHADRSPSCIVTTEPGRRFFGQFRCYGCSAKGTWFELAERAGLDSLTGSQFQSEYAPKFIDTYYEEAFLSEGPSGREADPKQQSTHDDTDDQAERPLGLYPFERTLARRLGIDKEWRGVPTKLLLEVGAELEYWRSPKYPTMTPRWLVFLPVYINGKRRGFSRALLEKPTGKRSSYLNKPGQWAKKYGLFPYDYAINLMEMRNLRTMVLVEGQRDALRLLRYGIPAVAILGTWSWSESKVRLLEMGGVERVVCLFDGDTAGIDATKTVVPTLSTRFDVHVMRLWQVARRLGLKKLDPFDMPLDLLKRLRATVYQKAGTL